MLKDLRYALRSLLRHPGSSALAILILAFAIGATTAVFGVVNAALLRPLPYSDPSRLVALSRVSPNSSREGPVALRDVEAWRAASRSFRSIGSFVFMALPVKARDQWFDVVAAGVDPQLLTTLGTRPLLGTNFSGTGSTRPDASAIVSDRFWRKALSADRDAIGRTILVDGKAYVVSGVLPPSFQFPRADASYFDRDVDLLIPISNIADEWGRASEQWFAIGRLGDAVTLAQAQSEVTSIDRRLPWRASARSAVRLSSLGELTSRSVRPALLLVFGLSGVLLLIACANVMSLWFSKSAARTREVAIRKAIGATTGGIVRQMMTESLGLTTIAGAVGVLLARAFQDTLLALSPFHVPVSGRIDVDGRVLGFAVLVCVVTAIVSAIFPALHSSLDRDHLLSGVGTRTSTGRLLTRVQRILSTAQVALGLALLTAAGLLVGSLWRLGAVDPGFRPEGVVGFTFDVPGNRSADRNAVLYERMLAAIEALPGVESAGLVNYLPPEQRKGVFVPVTIEGAAANLAPGGSFCDFSMTSATYFQTLGIPIVAGRAFTDADSRTSAPVAIVNDAFARRFLPDGRVLGRRVKTPFDARPREIVGVIGLVHDRGLGAPPVPALYAPFRQFAFSYGSVAVRAAIPAAQLVPEIRSAVAGVDRDVPLENFQTLDERIRQSLGEPRFYTVMATACAGLAVLFVALGLYGVISYSVSRRTAEIGLRVAVGASRSAILRMVLRQGLVVGVSGAAAGAALSFWSTRLLRGLLFEVKPADPLTFAAAAAFVIAVTLLASYLPARRASRIDPIVALRQE